MKVLGAAEPTTAGPYRLLAELGRGGMGRVLLGAAPDGRLVAVKQIRAALAEEDGFVARFRREVAASRKVSGAYTAAVVDSYIDTDVDGDTPWLASVFVPGPSLQDAVDTTGVLPEEPALRLAAGLAAALAEIHRAGLVHRDLKPSNVLLAADGTRVIDFGIARAVHGDGTELTRTGWLIGSPGFMSPEQAEGHEVTPASDVFSLGSVLVMACTGASPFAGPSAPRTLYSVVHDDPVLDGLPPRVREVAELCLAKDPSARPAPADLLAVIGPVAPSATPWPPAVQRLIDRQHADVAAVLSGGTPETTEVVAPPPETAEADPGETAETVATPAPTVVATRPRRRGRLLVALAAVLVLAAAGTLVWRPWESTGPDLTGTLFPLSGHTADVGGFAFSPDSTLLATGGDDTTVRLWDTRTRRQEAVLRHPEPVQDVAFSPDGATLATVSWNNVRFWDVATHRPRGAVLTLPEQVQYIDFTGDGTQLITSAFGVVRFWDATTHAEVGEPITRIEAPAPIDVSPDGRLLVTGSQLWLRLWDTRTHQQVGDAAVFDAPRQITAVAFSPSGDTIAVGMADGITHLWNVAQHRFDGELPGPEDRNTVPWLTHVAYGKANNTLVTSGADVQLWHTDPRRRLDRVLDNPSGVAFSPDGRMIATGERDKGTVWLYLL